ncbi:fumarylacetoacetate hydrolase family protein [Oscillibacter sp.]|uniref:fumarylacetoacetate hydrolase family protein n=1 Tax=Oscillibacter sp. TaxID=1945593 RepID=UPI001B401A9C|nr:fumarylacetoacetate hydrolase family protein [Oscillibacter sp.]MBP3509164.1 fumarylacetoacetate hydrolase family protein [Oscillibacter sp.]
MKLVTYLHDGKEAVGVLSGDGAAVRLLPFPDMNALIEAPRDRLLSAVKDAGDSLPLSAVTLLAPIPRPRQDVICLGINYKAHAEEAERYSSEAFKKERPIPIYFSKRVSEAVAPEGFIESHSGLVQRLDYEAELAVIISKTARNVRAADAADYIFGYTVLNDVSARLLQTTHKQWYFGKGLDGFTPMGPCITTADEIAFPPALRISSRVNGELRQDSTTDLLITSIADIIEELSSGMTLLPGTIIATGTPAGVGMGFDPPKFLKPGDVVECSIEGIGTLRNTVR